MRVATMNTNPIESAQHLLRQYRSQLQFALQESIEDPCAIRHILEQMEIDSGIYVSLNPTYAHSGTPFANFVYEHSLPEQLLSAFPKLEQGPGLFVHQEQAVLSILDNRHTIISTGTGSGKTESFLIPIIAYCLENTTPGVKAILIYPMNALAGDQVERIARCTEGTHLTFGLYTGATPEYSSEDNSESHCRNQLVSREAIRANPPDILVTNYVMLDRMLTREKDYRIFAESAQTLRYLVIDELHVYTGSKAAHLKYLLARLRWHFANNLTCIGTSATLASSQAGKEQLERFVTDLFEINSYEYIDASAEEGERPLDSAPILTDHDLEQMEFSSEETAANSLRRLTGEHITAFDFYQTPFRDSNAFRSLQNNSIVVAIEKALKESAQSFDDLARCVSRVLPPTAFGVLTPAKLLSKYLEAITYVNEKSGENEKPLLDVRTHVLVRHIDGHLKACPKCDRYFSGDRVHCPHDGHALFAVSRHNIRELIGKFSGQTLSPVIDRESTDRATTHYVTIQRVSSDDASQCELVGMIQPNGDFVFDSNGTYCLKHLPVTDVSQIESDLIWLDSSNRNHLYLYQLVKVLLQTYHKSLGFIDNRELASRYSAILTDEFIDDYLFEFLSVFYPRENQLDVARTLDYLQKSASRVAASDLEELIFFEMPIWYHRLVAIPERFGGICNLLKIKDDVVSWRTLPALAQELLRIFLKERAIQRDFHDAQPDSQFIRFQKFWATGRYGIYVENTISDDPDYRGLTLSDRSQEYADFVRAWSPQSIRDAIHDLCKAEILVSETSPDGKTAYYLRPEHVCFDLPTSTYSNLNDAYEQLKAEHLFVSAVHSSDLQPNERIRVEKDFRAGKTHFVTATPTLEMGIDIGDLESIVLFGAPPSPANYAQRAGRAGRGKKHHALIVTYCWGNNAHDMYMFQNPRQMINGQVEAPRFNPRNRSLVKKHIAAFVLRHHVHNRQALRNYLEQTDKYYVHAVPEMQRVFGDWFPYTDFRHELTQAVEQLLSEPDDNYSLAHRCYAKAIFPDYSFRHDQVIAIDITDKDKLDSEQPLSWQDYALTTRDVEQAVRLFAPDQTLYAAGEVYKTLNDGIYTKLPDGARQYVCYYAQKETRFAQRQKQVRVWDTRHHFTADLSHIKQKQEVVGFAYSTECQLSFRNYGLKDSRKENPQTDKQVPIGYDFSRESIILRFDSLVCNETLRNSLLAVLVREMNSYYDLAPGEIRLMLNAHLYGHDGEKWVFSLLYDNDGNNNLPLKHIMQDFDMLMQRAYDRLLSCDCNSDGCYNCIRSYSFHHVDDTLSKDRALMFLGFLLGHRLFEPSVAPYLPESPQADLSLVIRQQDEEVSVTCSSGQVYRQPIDGDLNSAIFSTLTQAIYNEYQRGMRILVIETWVQWLADSINQRKANKGVEAFNRFQFALLRFAHVDARFKPSRT